MEGPSDAASDSRRASAAHQRLVGTGHQLRVVPLDLVLLRLQLALRVGQLGLEPADAALLLLRPLELARHALQLRLGRLELRTHLLRSGLAARLRLARRLQRLLELR